MASRHTAADGTSRDSDDRHDRRRRVDRDRASDTDSAVADENIQAVARIKQRMAKHRTPLQRLSDGVAAVAAKESTVLIHVVWFAVWIIANVRLLPIEPFDPFPFGLLTTIVSLEAIFLSLFVLASQNRMTQDADRREHLDLQVDMLAEQEMTLVLQMLREVCEHLGLEKTIRSQKFVELVKRTDIGQLAERVEKNIGVDQR
jgi:uncharacterized membrane protein